MADLPAINTLLQVEVADDTSFSSRVEGAEGKLLMVSAPVGSGDVQIPADGWEMQITWTGNRTRFKAAVQMAGYTKDWPPRWQLRVVGEPERDTRRRFVRGGGGGPVSIRRTGSGSETGAAPAGSSTARPVAGPAGGRGAAGAMGGRGGAGSLGRAGGAGGARHAGAAGGAPGKGAVLVGWVVDLSEAGARCRMRGVEGDLAAGEEVVVELAIEGQTLDVDATVLTVRAETESDEIDVVVTYEPPERDAKVIRKHVLQWEIAQRGRNRGGGPRALAV